MNWTHAMLAAVQGRTYPIFLRGWAMPDRLYRLESYLVRRLVQQAHGDRQ